MERTDEPIGGEEVEYHSVLDAEHVHGNFRKYYNFHSSESRTSLIPSRFFSQSHAALGGGDSYSMLDVGCNDGTLTLALYERAKAELGPSITVTLVGIDIDSVLIDRANEAAQRCTSPSNVYFLVADIMDEASSLDAFMRKGICSSFSFVSCFSTTMWVHLHHGDEGLRTLLTKLNSTTNGFLLIEPQNWTSYQTAGKRIRKQRLPCPKYMGKLLIKDSLAFLHSLELAGSTQQLGREDWKERSLVLLSKVGAIAI
jgi:SAM-dependent methyltransferase